MTLNSIAAAMASLGLLGASTPLATSAARSEKTRRPAKDRTKIKAARKASRKARKK